MYRQYEDPRKLQEQLDNLKEEFQRRKSLGELDPYDYEDYALEIHDLEERINFAWQDEEYDDMNRDPEDERWMEENVYSATDVDNHYYYRISIGTGTAYVDSVVIETDRPTAYDTLTDILIDFLSERGDSRILYGPEYDWDDDYRTIHSIYGPDWVIYPSEFVQGGNAGNILHHYGEFRIEEITEDDITDYDIIIAEE